jgi:Fe-S cluster biosynthesis and repair protein YggX
LIGKILTNIIYKKYKFDYYIILKMSYHELNGEGTELIMRAARRPCPVKKSKPVPQKKSKPVPQKVTHEMQKFIENNFAEQANDESIYTRHELMRFVCDYIKSQNIQNPENMKMWSGEEKTLKELFNLKEKWYSFMQINGIISSCIKNSDEISEVYDAGNPKVSKGRKRYLASKKARDEWESRRTILLEEKKCEIASAKRKTEELKEDGKSYRRKDINTAYKNLARLERDYDLLIKETWHLSMGAPRAL